VADRLVAFSAVVAVDAFQFTKLAVAQFAVVLQIEVLVGGREIFRKVGVYGQIAKDSTLSFQRPEGLQGASPFSKTKPNRLRQVLCLLHLPCVA